MVVEPPPLSDPLSNIRGLAQFPKAIRVSENSNTLDSIHHLVKSRGAKNPEKVLEEAKKIVDGGSELLNSEYVAFTSSMGIGEASPRKENVNPQERRPGFGRRRAKFSIKPNLSQPPVSLVTSFDMAKFPDPEEFFAEYEKHENAQKEIERQMGGCVLSSIEDDILPQNAMKKRPGILGDSRRPVSYKHRYSQVISEIKEVELPSPEPSEHSNSTQRNSDIEVEPQDNGPAGSITKTDHEVNMILDELLSSNSEDLDSLLQNRLDIKPIDLNILSIPNFIDTEKIDFVSLGKNLSKPRRSPLTLENLKHVTPLSDKQMGRSANSSLESSTPRNLLGSLSSLRRRVIQSNRLGDLFSPCNIDLTSPKNSQPDQGSEPTNSKKRLGKKSTEGSLAGVSPLKTPSRESSHIDVAQNISPMNVLVPDDGNDMDEKMDDISIATPRNLLDPLSSLRRRGIQSNPLGNSSRNSQPDEGSEPTNPKKGLGERSNGVSPAGVSPLKTPSRESSHIDVAQNTSPMNVLVSDDGNDIDGKMDRISTDNAGDNDLVDKLAQGRENVDNTTSLAMSSSEGLERTNNDPDDSPIDNQEPHQMGENVKDMPSAIFSAQVDVSCKESMIADNVDLDQRSCDEPHADATEAHTSDTLPTAPVNISEQETKKLPSTDQEHKRRRTAVGITERKNLSKRKSILDGGTTFVSGLRRSKRIKTRPLEYWKGERPIYSRMNDSIKLTGFTYISPSKNSGILRVKSFI